MGLEGSIAEGEIEKSNSGTQSEIKTGNANAQFGVGNVSAGGEINLNSIQADKNKETVTLGKAELKGITGNKEINTDGSDSSVEVGVSFEAITVSLKANLTKIKDFIETSTKAVGAFVEEVLNESTNYSLPNKSKEPK